MYALDAFVVLLGLKLVLLIAIHQRIKENRRLRDELRRCHADLAAAVAHLQRGENVPARRLLEDWTWTDVGGSRPTQRPRDTEVRLH